jgi:Xaa-Pro aminopeptidase
VPDTLKLQRFEQALAATEFDVVVAASPDNTWYLSDAVLDTQRSLLERLALVVWAKGAPPVYIVCGNEEIQARRDTWIQDLRAYVEYQQSPHAVPGPCSNGTRRVMSSELILGGAEMQGFQVLAAATKSCSTHARASDYVLRSGDLMRTDFGGVFPGGYNSDLARTICVGEASRQQRETYAAIWGEHERLIAMLRPGGTCRELYDSHKAAWKAHGWPMVRPHIGHSLGIGLHEHPLLMPGDTTPLAPGMCMAIEPNHLLPEVEKYHVEDLVLVTEGAPRVLSRIADWSRLLEAGV